MLKSITAGLVFFLATFASQGAYAGPVPNPKFKIPGLGTYRSGVGFVDDVTELPWKQAADAERKAANKAASSGGSGASTGAAAMGGVAAGAVAGGVAGGAIGAGQGVASPGSN